MTVVPPRHRNSVGSLSNGSGQTGLLLDDPDSLLGRLHVAKASFDHVEPFSLDLFNRIKPVVRKTATDLKPNRLGQVASHAAGLYV